MAQKASKSAPESSGPRFWCLQAWIWMVICRNADPFLDGFGIILTMQIPSRLHVIEASKAFSKIAFVKELPVCSSIRRKNTLLNKSTRPLYVPAMARRLPKPLKEKLLKCDGKLIKFYVLTIIPKDTQNKAETDKHIQARFPSICSGFLRAKPPGLLILSDCFFPDLVSF